MSWYRWQVNFHMNGLVCNTIVEACTHDQAIVAARISYPSATSFSAIKCSTKPL